MDAAGLRPGRRRLRERLRRLDGVLLPLRPRDAVLARDGARDVVSATAAGQGERRARRGLRRPGPAGHDIRDPVSLVRAELAALSFYWTFLAGIGVLTWIVLYLI